MFKKLHFAMLLKCFSITFLLCCGRALSSSEGLRELVQVHELSIDPENERLALQTAKPRKVNQAKGSPKLQELPQGTKMICNKNADGCTIMSGPLNVYNIYVGKPGPTTNIKDSTKAEIEYFLTNLNGSPYYSTIQSYVDSAGFPASNSITFVKSIDVSSVGMGPLSGSEAFKIISGLLDSKKLPTDFNGHYNFLFKEGTPFVGYAGLGPASEGGWCGYHSTFTRYNPRKGKTGEIKFNIVGIPNPWTPTNQGCAKFSTTTYPGYSVSPLNPNDLDADNTITYIFHEIVEATSDPTSSGWVAQGAIAQGENGDICNEVFTPVLPSCGSNPPGTLCNVQIGTHYYYTQANYVKTGGVFTPGSTSGTTYTPNGWAGETWACAYSMTPTALPDKTPAPTMSPTSVSITYKGGPLLVQDVVPVYMIYMTQVSEKVGDILQRFIVDLSGSTYFAGPLSTYKDSNNKSPTGKLKLAGSVYIPQPPLGTTFSFPAGDALRTLVKGYIDGNQLGLPKVANAIYVLFTKFVTIDQYGSDTTGAPPGCFAQANLVWDDGTVATLVVVPDGTSAPYDNPSAKMNNFGSPFASKCTPFDLTINNNPAADNYILNLVPALFNAILNPQGGMAAINPAPGYENKNVQDNLVFGSPSWNCWNNYGNNLVTESPPSNFDVKSRKYLVPQLTTSSGICSQAGLGKGVALKQLRTEEENSVSTPFLSGLVRSVSRILFGL